MFVQHPTLLGKSLFEGAPFCGDTGTINDSPYS